MERVILHCDCNCFFASVEAAFEPELNNYPFAVCGNPEYRHGIVLAKNEKAKKYGITTGEAIWQAKAKCPQLRIVMPNYGRYKAYSEKIFSIYCRFTDLVEPFGMDEAWLDVTGSVKLFGSGREIADELRRIIKDEVGVTISVGVSYNKIFAKMGSDYKKPDATTEITKENFKDLLYPLPAGDLFMIGRKSAEKLRNVGLNTIGDIAGMGEDVMERLLGAGGRVAYSSVLGCDYSRVLPFNYREAYKSIGNGMTFKRDLENEEDIRTCVFFLCDKVSGRLRKHGAVCGGISVGIRDTDMHTVLRSGVLSSPTDLSFDLRENAIELIMKNMPKDGKMIRAITVTGTHLSDTANFCEQVSFFNLDYHLKRQREESLEHTKDKIRNKYGGEALTRCSLINNEFGI